MNALAAEVTALEEEVRVATEYEQTNSQAARRARLADLNVRLDASAKAQGEEQLRVRSEVIRLCKGLESAYEEYIAALKAVTYAGETISLLRAELHEKRASARRVNIDVPSQPRKLGMRASDDADVRNLIYRSRAVTSTDL